jgi:hypothetical protein
MMIYQAAAGDFLRSLQNFVKPAAAAPKHRKIAALPIHPMYPP